LYLGKSGNLRNRLKYLLKHFLPEGFAGNWGKHTAREALSKIIKETEIIPRLCFLEHDEPRVIESKLLSAFYHNHIEAPPLNN